jgi:hypothetical protein
MRLYIILTVAVAFFCSFVHTASIPFEDMTDFEIAKMFVKNAASTGSQTLFSNKDAVDGDKNGIFYPPNNVTWYVGELVNVTYESTEPAVETVSIFFFDKTDLLAGGPLTKKVFPFVVPANAVSPVGGTSLLLAVRRQNLYLQTVDSLIIQVLPGKPSSN